MMDCSECGREQDKWFNSRKCDPPLGYIWMYVPLFENVEIALYSGKKYEDNFTGGPLPIDDITGSIIYNWAKCIEPKVK